MSAQFPPCPPQYKQLQHYLKIAAEHDQRDPIVSYWCMQIIIFTFKFELYT